MWKEALLIWGEGEWVAGGVLLFIEIGRVLGLIVFTKYRGCEGEAFCCLFFLLILLCFLSLGVAVVLLLRWGSAFRELSLVVCSLEKGQ